MPLRALSWIDEQDLRNKFASPEFFDDLVHLVRARVRVAQWELSVGVENTAKQWKQLGVERHRLAGPIVRSCRWLMEGLGLRKR